MLQLHKEYTNKVAGINYGINPATVVNSLRSEFSQQSLLQIESSVDKAERATP